MTDDMRRQLTELVDSHGLELLAIERAGGGREAKLRLIVEGPAGVTVDQCAGVAREASALLDVEAPTAHGCSLEVSSPGLERKLYSRGDYHRFAGRVVKVRMRPSFREVRVATGELIGLEGETVRVQDAEQGLVELPLDEVFEARLQVDWDELMRGGKSRL